ncbi:SAV_6107 family HEPN domain-containing protein [Saccharomonospora marina]|uniref:SAV_6107 family HEPN domain-containing protein n=1 Tax=Saccharomonospora marina TaxID=632569 RepID=UPI0002F71A59|nr:SAV_6107 family HEPN domain-containing protein [Saccharomonospora marina]
MSVAFASRHGPRSRNGSVQPALPIELRPPVASSAVALLEQARHGLAEADWESRPASGFVVAYLSALRAAAAILVARGRPHRGRAKPESVWTLLESAAPELASWASFFAANSAKHAAAQAGVTRRVNEDAAAELLRRAKEFVAIAHRAVHGQGGAPGTRDAPGRRSLPGERGARGDRVARCGAASRARPRRSG